MNIDVEELATVQDAEIETFLDELGSLSHAVLGYHYPFYRDVLVEMGVGKPVYLGARLGGELVGMLPAFVRESEIGSAYCSLPFFGPNAGVLCADGRHQDDIHAALLQALLDRARQANALSCSVYTPFLFEDFAQYDRFRPDVVVEKFTQYTNLQGAAWNSSIRYDLRRAERLGVTIEEGILPERLDAFYAIYRSNCEDYGIPLKPKRCVELLVEPHVVGRRTRLYFAMQGGQMIAGLLAIHSPATASYYIPCTLHEARTLQPGTVLINRSFQDVQEAGVQIWNWEASPSRESGVYRYKEKWNAVEKTYRIYIWTPRGLEPFRQAGKDRLATEFPYFFIYPYDRL